MPSSQHQANPNQRERRCDWELEHLGFREGGSRKEEVSGSVAGVEFWNSLGSGTGDWDSWVLHGSWDKLANEGTGSSSSCFWALAVS